MAFSTLFNFPMPAYGCQRANISSSGVDLILQIEYESEKSIKKCTVIFKKVVGYKFISEGHSSTYPPESSESVAVSCDTPWLKELNQRVSDFRRWPFERKHFCVFLRNEGFYEVVAEVAEFDDK